jgi:hypothetical protein
MQLRSLRLGRSPDTTMAGSGFALRRLRSLCLGGGLDRMTGRGFSFIRPC